MEILSWVLHHMLSQWSMVIIKVTKENKISEPFLILQEWFRFFQGPYLMHAIIL